MIPTFWKVLKNFMNYVHFIGIGGISMSGLAKILLSNGVKVSGSDMKSSHLTDDLIKSGASVTIGHSADNIKDPDLVVYTAAISDDNPELCEARRRGIKSVERAELVGYIMKQYKTAIAVSGTHGKTTTTSMISHVLLENETDPTIMVGGELDAIGGNLRTGGKDIFLTEACEYHRSFLKFCYKIGIILNVDADHLDYFKDIDEIIDTFGDFAAKIPSDGVLIVSCDNENSMKAAKKANCSIITIGRHEADFTAKNITFDAFGKANFDVYYKGEYVTDLMLGVIGTHNVYNALAAFACGVELGFDVEKIKHGIESFHGTHRRFEKKGYMGSIPVYDDYAHHPTEIKATLKTASKMEINEIWCVFQPHTYTRTKVLFDDFIKVLSYADHVVLADVYAAREKDTGLVSSKQLADKMENAVYFKTFEEIEDYIAKNAKDGDIVITMGAGDIYKVGEDLVKRK